MKLPGKFQFEVVHEIICIFPESWGILLLDRKEGSMQT